MEPKIGLTDDTICAISTAPGVGGIAVVRVSGSNALSIVSQVWRGKPLAGMTSHTAHFGVVVDVADGSDLDEVVLTVFRAPHTFTGEDVVEISCHGSLWIQQQIVRTLIDAGARMADPGEFTRRAFLNGRMDLAQAEAVADMIAANSRASQRIAINQMRGGFSRQLADLRAKLLELASLLELELDFSEEDVEFADRSSLVAIAEEILRLIDSLADSFAVGNAIKNGIPVAIVGATNAGKSTLLNTLLCEDRALVSDIHGTTRDAIEDTAMIDGTLFRFIDTAGLRRTDDVVESMGIEQTLNRIDKARVLIWVVDSSVPADMAVFKDIRNHLPADASLIVALNKTDIACDVSAVRQTIEREVAELWSGEKSFVEISARENRGIDTLKSMLKKSAETSETSTDGVIVTNARHYHALRQAGEALRRARLALHTGKENGSLIPQEATGYKQMPIETNPASVAAESNWVSESTTPASVATNKKSVETNPTSVPIGYDMISPTAIISGDLIAQDIREAIHYLGEITGDITTTDILTSIFTRFCVGK